MRTRDVPELPERVGEEAVSPPGSCPPGVCQDCDAFNHVGMWYYDVDPVAVVEIATLTHDTDALEWARQRLGLSETPLDPMSPCT